MPDMKISEDADAGALDGTELVPVVDTDGSNKTTTTQKIADLAVGGGGGGGALDDLSDVTITAPGTGAALIYNGAGSWVDGTPDPPVLSSGTFLANPGASTSAATEAALTDILDRALGTVGSGDGKVLGKASGVWGAQTPAGGGGSGLFSSIITAPPTIGSGAWTPVNAPVGGDVTGGIVLRDNGGVFRGYRMPAPATPYTRTAIITTAIIVPTGSGPLFGLFASDGTKFQRMYLVGHSPFSMTVDNYSTVSSFAATAMTPKPIAGIPAVVILRVADDGTNFLYQYSADGQTWITLLSVTKTGSYLGAGGFNFIGFDLDADSSDNSIFLQSWS